SRRRSPQQRQRGPAGGSGGVAGMTLIRPASLITEPPSPPGKEEREKERDPPPCPPQLPGMGQGRRLSRTSNQLAQPSGSARGSSGNRGKDIRTLEESYGTRPLAGRKGKGASLPVPNRGMRRHDGSANRDISELEGDD
ncbi:unnamed protein product, partial [Discosporangium mesarthrocarpum]